MDISTMNNTQLMKVLATSTDEALIDDVYNELDNRQEAAENFDWTEQDARAASEDVFEMYRAEH